MQIVSSAPSVIANRERIDSLVAVIFVFFQLSLVPYAYQDSVLHLQSKLNLNKLLLISDRHTVNCSRYFFFFFLFILKIVRLILSCIYSSLKMIDSLIHFCNFIPNIRDFERKHWYLSWTYYTTILPSSTLTFLIRFLWKSTCSVSYAVCFLCGVNI